MAISCLQVIANVGLAQGTVAIVPIGSVYSYRDNGSDQGAAWQSVSFNDSAWSLGQAPLGYGQSSVNTVIGHGTNAANKYITTYFRHAFTTSPNASISNLLVRLRRDDGVVVYLNGVEVFRSNMPTGRVDNLTLAASAVTGADETNYFRSPVITGSLLQFPGLTNVLAAEVHQASQSSPDLVFCSELTGNAALPTSLTLQIPAGFSTIANNFNHGSNTLNEVIPFAAAGTLILFWNDTTHSYQTNYYDENLAAWFDVATASPSGPLRVGRGAFIFSPFAQSLTISGPVPPAPTQHPYPADGRLYLVGCRWPQASTFEEIMGFPPVEGDKMLFHEGSSAAFPPPPPWGVFTFRNNTWTPGPPPLLSPGQAVFVDLVDAPTLAITPAASGSVGISWTPASFNWVLQETFGLSAPVWSNSPSSTSNPVVLPISAPAKFYRLIKP